VRIGTVDGDANVNCLKAPLKLSRGHFQRVFYTYRRPFGQAPVVLRCFVENRMLGEGVGANCGRDGDPNLNRLKAPLILSVRRFQRRFQ
jgi:hypothetical protein